MYRSRGTDVNPQRLLFTGDVYSGGAIAGVQDSGLAIVIEHPCTMRGTMAQLNDFVLAISVREHEPMGANGWKTRCYDLTPLPDLTGTQLYVGDFLKVGRASTSELSSKPRLACASEFGINLLQQRLVWHMTRCLIPTSTISEAFSHLFEEADLCEDWTDTLFEVGINEVEARQSFDAFLTADLGNGRTLQKDLSETQLRSAVRAQCRTAAQDIVRARREGE